MSRHFVPSRGDSDKQQSQSTHSRHFSDHKSTEFKRALHYNMWERPGDSEMNEAGKRIRLSERPTLAPIDNDVRRKQSRVTPIPIDSLKPGNYQFDASVEFRVTGLKFYENEKKLKTVAFYGMDDTAEIFFMAYHAESLKIEKLLKINGCYKLKAFDVIHEDPNRQSSFIGHSSFVRLNRSSELHAVGKHPPIQFDFVLLDEIRDKKKDDLIDIRGVVAKNWGLKVGHEQGESYRLLTITDSSSEACVMLRLRNLEAEAFGDKEDVVIAVRKARVQCGDDADGTKFLYSSQRTLIWDEYFDPDKDELLGTFLKKKYSLKGSRE